MNYIPTAAELILLSFLKKQGNCTAERNLIVQLFSEDHLADSAIEGCRTKGFITENSNTISLTSYGKTLV